LSQKKKKKLRGWGRAPQNPKKEKNPQNPMEKTRGVSGKVREKTRKQKNEESFSGMLFWGQV